MTESWIKLNNYKNKYLYQKYSMVNIHTKYTNIRYFLFYNCRIMIDIGIQ